MVCDEETKTIKGLVQAERKAPPTYDLARQLLIAVLKGDLTIEDSLRQARATNFVERQCAIEILTTGLKYLEQRTGAEIVHLPAMSRLLSNGLKLSVGPVYLHRTNPENLLDLHLWRSPLSSGKLALQPEF